MSRDKAFEVMNILRFGTFEEVINTREIVNEALDAAIEALKERPHGEWEYVTHYGRRFRVCSVCKAEKEDDRATGWNFCQCCGSDNRKRGDAE